MQRVSGGSRGMFSELECGKKRSAFAPRMRRIINCCSRYSELRTIVHFMDGKRRTRRTSTFYFKEVNNFCHFEPNKEMVLVISLNK